MKTAMTQEKASYGLTAHALFNKEKLSRTLGQYNNILNNNPNAPILKTPVIKFYRRQDDPNKVQIAQHIGDNKRAVEGSKDMGVVYTEAVAKMSFHQIIDLFGGNKIDVSAIVQEIEKVETMENIKTMQDLLGLKPTG